MTGRNDNCNLADKENWPCQHSIVEPLPGYNVLEVNSCPEKCQYFTMRPKIICDGDCKVCPLDSMDVGFSAEHTPEDIKDKIDKGATVQVRVCEILRNAGAILVEKFR